MAMLKVKKKKDVKSKPAAKGGKAPSDYDKPKAKKSKK